VMPRGPDMQTRARGMAKYAELVLWAMNYHAPAVNTLTPRIPQTPAATVRLNNPQPGKGIGIRVLPSQRAVTLIYRCCW
jgi:hypothetical protein